MNDKLKRLLIFLALIPVFAGVDYLTHDANLAFSCVTVALIFAFLFIEWAKKPRSPLSWSVYCLFIVLHIATVAWFRPSMDAYVKAAYVLGLLVDSSIMYGLLVLADRLSIRPLPTSRT